MKLVHDNKKNMEFEISVFQDLPFKYEYPKHLDLYLNWRFHIWAKLAAPVECILVLYEHRVCSEV